MGAGDKIEKLIFMPSEWIQIKFYWDTIGKLVKFVHHVGNNPATMITNVLEKDVSLLVAYPLKSPINRIFAYIQAQVLELMILQVFLESHGFKTKCSVVKGASWIMGWSQNGLSMKLEVIIVCTSIAWFKTADPSNRVEATHKLTQQILQMLTAAVVTEYCPQLIVQERNSLQNIWLKPPSQ